MNQNTRASKLAGKMSHKAKRVFFARYCPTLGYVRLGIAEKLLKLPEHDFKSATKNYLTLRKFIISEEKKLKEKLGESSVIEREKRLRVIRPLFIPAVITPFAVFASEMSTGEKIGTVAGIMSGLLTLGAFAKLPSGKRYLAAFRKKLSRLTSEERKALLHQIQLRRQVIKRDAMRPNKIGMGLH